MSSLAELSRRLTRLREISGIMTAMKSLSLVETHKLARFMVQQRQMLFNIEEAAADFLHFFPLPYTIGEEQAIVLLIGSERGFCGNFNERVLAALESLPAWTTPPRLVVVGHRLATKLEARPDVMVQIDGPTVTEEIPAVLGRLMDALHAGSQQSAATTIALHGLAHDAEGELHLKQLLPLPVLSSPLFTQAPRLNLAPTEFLAELLDQYLLAALHGLLYESLAAENRQRLAHMENALARLDETLAGLALKRNALRQERIVEEIEVMLSGKLAFGGAN
jgi:F-type H+-transporting ATPase subunit gamma